MEELQMDKCPYDSTAPAMVICDYGEFDNVNFRFSRTLRIKILRKEGLYLANQIFKGSDKQSINGKTFNLIDGKIVEDKLSKESIFTERVTDNYFRIRVSMPNVKEGSIIDIQYYQESLPNQWQFQEEIPVLRSELYLPSSPNIDFRKNYAGYLPLNFATDDHWIAKDVPAFKEEPYISSAANYMARMSIDILSVNFPGYIKAFTTDWDAVARLLHESQYFGQLLGNALYLKDMENEIRSKATSDYDKMKLAYDTLKSLKWNGNLALTSSKNNLRICMNDGAASSTEINLTLTNLLNRLDIEAYPIVMSTRENGYLSTYFPSIEKLNNTIVIAYLGDKSYFLDASEELMPVGCLPKRSLNGSGVIIKGTKATKVELSSDNVDEKINILKLALNDDLVLTGKYSCEMRDYAGYFYRKRYEKYNSESEFLKELESNLMGIQIDNYKATNLKDIYKPVQTEMDVEIENQAYNIGDEVFINPLLFFQTKENPFKAEERLYPIDFAYLQQEGFSIELTIPENYSITTVPKAQVVTLPDKSAKFLYQATQLDNKVVVNCVIAFNKEIFLPQEYPLIKQFYDIIVNKQAEPIILKKL